MPQNFYVCKSKKKSVNNILQPVMIIIKRKKNSVFDS